MPFLTRLSKVGLAKEATPYVYVVPTISVPWNTGKWADVIDPLRDESIRANDSVVQGIAQGPAHSTWELDCNFYPDLAGYFLRGIIGPDTVSAGVSTTLASNAILGATTLSLTASVPNNSVLQVSDSGGANLEWVQVGTITGAGPYSAPITSPASGTRFAHTAVGGSVISQSTHTFAQNRSFATVWPTYSITLDDGQEQLGFPGCVMSELQLKIDPKGFVTMAPKWTGMPSAVQATFAYAASLVQPVVGWGWTVANPSASTRGLTFDYTLKRAVELIQSSDGVQAPRDIFAGALEGDGQYKTVYDSSADMALFKQGIQGVTTHTVTNPVTSGGQSLAITMSKGGYTTSEADSGQPYLQLTQAVTAIANATDTGITTVVLKNFQSTAY